METALFWINGLLVTDIRSTFDLYLYLYYKLNFIPYLKLSPPMRQGVM